MAFALRCAEKRPYCLRGPPPSAARGRGRAAGSDRPSIRQRRDAVTNPALPVPCRAQPRVLRGVEDTGRCSVPYFPVWLPEKNQVVRPKTIKMV